MSELEDKRAAAEKLWREIRDLEEKKRREEEWPIWKAREGSYWKFHNCYSCPESDADRWWIYRRISNITRDGCMDTLDVQIDKYGRLEVRHQTGLNWDFTTGWIPATEGEWREAALMAQAIVGKLLT